MFIDFRNLVEIIPYQIICDDLMEGKEEKGVLLKVTKIAINFEYFIHIK